MANPFDQFDQKPTNAANPFDQFDAAPAGRGASAIPLAPGAEQAMAAEYAARPKAQPVSLMDRIKGGAEAAASIATGATTGALGYIGGAIKGVAGSVADGTFGTDAGLRSAGDAANAGAASLTYHPSTATGQEYTQAIGEAINDSGVAGLPIGAEMAIAGRLAAPATRQVGRAAKGVVDPVIQAVKDSPEAFAAGRLAERVAKTRLTPKIDRERAQLAAKAAEKGIEAPLHTLIDNKYARLAGEFLDNLPVSGSAKENNNVAFQRSLIEQIGGDAKKHESLTPTVLAQAQIKAGKSIGEVFGKISVPFADDALQSDLATLRQGLGRELSDVDKVINGNINELTRLAENNNGVIPGTALKKLHSDVAATLRSSGADNVPGLRQRLSDFQGILEDAADRAITSPEDKAKYQVSRVQYAKTKTLEPLVARGGINGVSPQGLLQQISNNSIGKHRVATNSAGELGELAQIAQSFMKEQGSSGTAERHFAQNAVSSIGGAVSAAAGITVGNLYNRVARPLARRAVRNSVMDDAVPLADFQPGGLALVEESPFRAPVAEVVPDQPYNGVLQLADDLDYERMQYKVPESEQLANRPDYPSIDYPVTPAQRVMQPAVVEAIDGFRREASRLQEVVRSAPDAPTRSRALLDLAQLQADFDLQMKQAGVSEKANAYTATQPLGITKTMDRVARQRALKNIGQAQTVDEAIQAASGQ